MYFALKDTSEIGNALQEKWETWNLFLQQSGRQLLYNNLYQAFYQGKYNCGELYTTGENGEFLNLNVADFRNNMLHIKSLILSQKITLSPAATNTDVQTLSTVLLGKSVLADYARQMKFDLMMDQSIELANLYADMYALLEWDGAKGKPYMKDENGMTVYEGDPHITLFPQHMVGIDPINPISQWHILMCKGNKYDLAFQFPEYANEIEGCEIEDEYRLYGRNIITQAKYSDDTIYYYRFFHRDTPLVPGGREVIYINNNLVLSDQVLQTPFYPVTKFQVSAMEDSPLGYSQSFDAAQLAFALNKVYSTIVTNESKFGVQLVLVPKGGDFEVTDVVDGAKFLEYDPQAGIPSSLNLLNTSEHTYTLLKLLETKIDLTFGMNMVTKGQAPENVDSGSGLALLQSMAVQFNSQLQKNFIVFLEELSTKLLQLLQMKVKNNRLVDIVGVDQAQYIKEWNGDALKGLSKVVVELGDPAKDTAVGRQQMADQILQYGDLTLDQYMQIRETGSTGLATNDNVSHAMLISRENEELMKGVSPILSKSDNHVEHFKKHRCLLDQPQIRSNPKAAQIILMHMAQHEQMQKFLEATDPLFLQMSGQPILTPPQLPQGSPPSGVPGVPPGVELPEQPQNPLSGERFNTANGGLSGAQ